VTGAGAGGAGVPGARRAALYFKPDQDVPAAAYGNA